MSPGGSSSLKYEEEPFFPLVCEGSPPSWPSAPARTFFFRCKMTFDILSEIQNGAQKCNMKTRLIEEYNIQHLHSDTIHPIF